MNISRRRVLVDESELSIESGNLLDVLFVNNNGDKLLLSSENWPSSNNWTPIGVAIVPSSHNIYGDESYGIVSLVYMSSSNPTIGNKDSVETMPWGKTNNLITSFKINYTDFNLVNVETHELIGVNGEVKLPTDGVSWLSPIMCLHDNNSFYSPNSLSGVDYLAPSPYLTDGNYNPEYCQTDSPATNLNAFSDFKGVGNTKYIILERRSKDYSSWTPGTTEANYPAASCCDMFYTLGVLQGLWYLPSMGELGYLVSRRGSFNLTILALNKKYGKVGCELSYDGVICSSTLYDKDYICASYMNDCTASNYLKNYSMSCRAFTKYGTPRLVDDYVDLKLPSGTLWATKNIGASTEHEYGNLYGYGTGTTTYKNAATYNGTEDPLSLDYDTAYLATNHQQRMPSVDLINELKENTNYIWIWNYRGTGINGAVFQCKTDHSKYIFMPAAGQDLYSSSYGWQGNSYINSMGWYRTRNWTAKNNSDSSKSSVFPFGQVLASDVTNVPRQSGISVRGVKI